jgi:predicted NAD/FAD-binding protein
MCIPAKATALLLEEQTWMEQFIFSKIRYEGEHVVLHTDSSFLPDDKVRQQARWKCGRDAGETEGETGVDGEKTRQREMG